MPASIAVTETVRHAMTERPITVHPDTSAAEFYRLLEEHGITTCPVVTETGELKGMASRVDLLRTLRPSRELDVLGPSELSGITVREIMRCGVVTLEPEDPLVAALDLFVDTRFHALPVVRRGPGNPVVVGIITQGDVVRRLATPLRTSP
jgi:CBS domain-containing protein